MPENLSGRSWRQWNTALPSSITNISLGYDVTAAFSLSPTKWCIPLDLSVLLKNPSADAIDEPMAYQPL